MAHAFRILAAISLCAFPLLASATQDQVQPAGDAAAEEPLPPPPGFQYPEAWSAGLLVVASDPDGVLGGRPPVLAVKTTQAVRIPLADDGQAPDAAAGDGVYTGLGQVPPAQNANFVLLDAAGAELWSDQAPLSEAETRPRLGFHLGSFGVLASLRTMNDPLGEPLAKADEQEQELLELLSQRQPLPPFLPDLLTYIAVLGLAGGFLVSWLLRHRLQRPPVTAPVGGAAERSDGV